MGSQKIKKTEGGTGGKRGHSNMEHWEYTEVIKKAAKIQRRIEDKNLSRQALAKHRSGKAATKNRRVMDSHANFLLSPSC